MPNPDALARRPFLGVLYILLACVATVGLAYLCGGHATHTRPPMLADHVVASCHNEHHTDDGGWDEEVCGTSRGWEAFGYVQSPNGEAAAVRLPTDDGSLIRHHGRQHA